MKYKKKIKTKRKEWEYGPTPTRWTRFRARMLYTVQHTRIFDVLEVLIVIIMSVTYVVSIGALISEWI